MPQPFAPPSDQPPIDDSFPGGDDFDAAPGLTLTTDQLASAGLAGLMEGDSFTVTITGTVTSSEGDLTADIVSATGGKLNGGMESEAMPEVKEEDEAMRPGVKGPKSAGFKFKPDEEA